MSVIVDITKDLGSFKLEVSFETEGGVVGLLGSSGCGKSMTLRCIAGIVRPDRGRIVVEGRTLFDSERGIDIKPQRRGVGLLFQNYALFPNMTVGENISAVLALRSRSDIQRRLRGYLERFFLVGLEDRYPSALSGGQQQRVALARMIASEPSILMLDEPLSALDSYLRWQIEEQLADLFAEFTGTVLYVSHSREEVFRLCSSVCVVNDGRSEPIVSTKSLFHHPTTMAAALLSGCKNFSRAERIGPHTVRAIDWNALLTCETPVPEGTSRIGVRAHFIKTCADGSDNAIMCTVDRIIEDIFSTVVNFLPDGAPDGDLRMIRAEMPKEEAAGIRRGDRMAICLRGSDIMPLVD